MIGLRSLRGRRPRRRSAHAPLQEGGLVVPAGRCAGHLHGTGDESGLSSSVCMVVIVIAAYMAWRI